MDTSNWPSAVLLIAAAVYLLLPQRWRRLRWLNFFVWWVVIGSIVVFTLVGDDVDRYNLWLPWILISGVGVAMASLLTLSVPSIKSKE